MSSRFLVGVGAWLLGAVTATGGSMIAVNELAHGLLDAQAQQLGGMSVSADREPGGSSSGASPAVNPSPSTQVRPPAAKAAHSASPGSAGASSGSGRGSSGGSNGGSSGGSSSPAAGSSPSPSSGSSSSSPAGTLLVSSGGSVMASCESGSAYLQYWSPAQGYEADDVNRGPAAIASVVFRGAAGNSIAMRVSCSGGTPVAHVYQGGDE